MRFVEEDFAIPYKNLQALLSVGEITYELLWAMFPPDELVIALAQGRLRQPQAMPTTNSGYSKRRNGEQYFYANGKVVTHDGEDFGRGTIEMVIEHFEGTRKVTSLAFFPLKYCAQGPTIRTRLIARGKKYIACLKTPVCQEYSSYAIADSEIQNERPADNIEKINVRP